ncbi:MAG: YtxH domain-containing protein [Dehalococcoidia bacterium]
MALSDQLYTLAARAKQAEDNVTAARTKAKAELEADVQAAQESAKKHAEALRAKVDEGKESVSTGWSNVQHSFHDKIATAKLNMEVRKAERDLKRAEKDAERAERDAAFAVEFAYAAIEEAEYEVLDAILARAYADELAATSPGS